MSDFALKVEGYYKDGLWVIARVQKALQMGYITQQEYNQIIM